jgi:hypothetical protein
MAEEIRHHWRGGLSIVALWVLAGRCGTDWHARLFRRRSRGMLFLSFYLSIFLSFYLSIFLSFYLSIFLSFYLSIFLSFYLSIFS